MLYFKRTVQPFSREYQYNGKSAYVAFSSEVVWKTNAVAFACALNLYCLYISTTLISTFSGYWGKLFSRQTNFAALLIYKSL